MSSTLSALPAPALPTLNETRKLKVNGGKTKRRCLVCRRDFWSDKIRRHVWNVHVLRSCPSWPRFEVLQRATARLPDSPWKSVCLLLDPFFSTTSSHHDLTEARTAFARLHTFVKALLRFYLHPSATAAATTAAAAAADGGDSDDGMPSSPTTTIDPLSQPPSSPSSPAPSSDFHDSRDLSDDAAVATFEQQLQPCSPTASQARTEPAAAVTAPPNNDLRILVRLPDGRTGVWHERYKDENTVAQVTEHMRVRYAMPLAKLLWSGGELWPGDVFAEVCRDGDLLVATVGTEASIPEAPSQVAS